MESNICMNAACKAVTSAEWKKGWNLRSGGFATLCFNCGYAYENMAFCDTFHMEETGWRECSVCKKRLHCGCIASKTLLELLEFGGVGCSGCARSYQPHLIQSSQVSNDIDTSTTNNVSNIQSTPVTNVVDGDTVSKYTLLEFGSDTVGKENILQWTPETVTKERVLRLSVDDAGDEKPLKLGSGAVSKEKVMQLGSEAVSMERRLHSGNFMDTNEFGHVPPPIKAERNQSNGIWGPPIGDMGARFLTLHQPSGFSSQFSKPNNNSPSSGDKVIYELYRQPSTSMSLSSPSEAPNLKPSFLSGVVDGKELNKAHSSFQRSRLILPKPSKMGPNVSLDTNKSPSIPVRVARPPGEGRGGNQLLPRYWPRITDEELILLSAELKSDVVPLFEKVLSASDAGRIGRLVLPKACAEAYFPPIIQSEGLPVRVQDAKGKEWIFQFRFWPNNNSRMYVLEGVTPCIQSMQLEAGDTVTFSRMDPGGKLVIGSRKATGTVDTQDGETSALPTGATLPGEMQFSPANGFTGLFPSPNEYKDSTHSMSYDHLTDENINWPKSEKLQKDILSKKKIRNIIGSKSKRLLIDSDDATELRFTWEEAQDLLRPPPSVKPNIVSIEDHEIEEYDEPPVFGKRTIFTVQASGEQEQWAQCDDCSKWRRLPIDFLVPSRWTCLDNAWDPSRRSCSAPDDMSSREVENIFKPSNKSFKKRRTTENIVVQEDRVACGLDALASAAILGENASDSADGPIGATTKHPRHRPGCTCIVCIQPPSGKGKHKRTCTCNVCLSVKRRFETMMNRKRSRQMERDAEVSQQDDVVMIDPPNVPLHTVQREMNEKETGGNGHIDLNFQPDHREDTQNEANEMSMTAEVAGFPLEKYLKQNRLVGLAACSLSLQQTEECLPDQLENGSKSPDGKPDTEAAAEETHSNQNLGKLD